MFFGGLVHSTAAASRKGEVPTAATCGLEIYSLRRKRHIVHEQLAAWRTNRSAASPQVGDLAFHPFFYKGDAGTG